MLARELGEPALVVNTLILLGDAARLRGEDDLARARYDESRIPSIVEWVPWQLRNSGFLAVHRGELGTAESHFRESLSGYQGASLALGRVEGLVGFASLAAALGNAGRGARLFGAVAGALTTIGVEL